MIRQIVTHPGQAHLDDFMAVCLALALEGTVPVHRREPTTDELADAGTLILDVGRVHDPGLYNFDHHQDGALPCAARLYAISREIDSTMGICHGWWMAMDAADRGGPMALANHLSMRDASKVYAAMSPLQEFTLIEFAKAKSIYLVDELQKYAAIGHNVLRKTERFERLKRDATISYLNGVAVVLHEIEDDPTLALNEYRAHEWPVLGMSVIPDDRGPGWCLYRFEDHPRVDFRRIANRQEVSFAHGSGFIAKTVRMTRKDVLTLALDAVSSD